MKIIKIKLIVEDTCNPSNQDAISYVNDLICEAISREERQKHPRIKLILIESKHIG
jgi:hypothetical protein